MQRLAFLPLFVGLSAGCAGNAGSPPVSPAAPQPSGSPCIVSEADVDSPDARCLVAYDDFAAPPAGALAMRLLEPTGSLKSGEQATLTLEMRNVSGHRLVVPLQDGCLAWDAQASSATASTFESECGGLCGRGREMLQLTVEPGGVLHKRVQLTTRMVRVTGDSCTRGDLGPLPPGQYTLRVTLPWTEPSPIPGNPQARASRVFETPVTVIR